MAAPLNTIARISASEFLPLFKREYLKEYVRTNRFSRYMGTKEDMPIQFKYELKSEGGQSIQFNFLRKATTGGVGGNMLLEGREGSITREKCVIYAHYMREGFAVTKSDEKKSIVELLPAFKDTLMNWSKERVRDRVIDGLFMVSPDTCSVVPLWNPDATRWVSGDPAVETITATASAANLTTWLTNNADRVIFGNSGATSSTTFATAAATVTQSTDGFLTKSVSMMKDAAKNANPGIQPIRIGEEDEEYFVIFCDTTAFRQLQADPAMLAANQYARSREGAGWTKNPIRTGSDLEWDGCIIREIPEIKPIIYDSTPVAWRAFATGDTKSSAVKCRAVLCGANAVGVAVGQSPDFPDQQRDYGFRKGLAIEEMLGVNKIQRNDLTTTTKYVDNATVTWYGNAAA